MHPLVHSPTQNALKTKWYNLKSWFNPDMTKRRPSQCSLESTTSTNSGYYPKRLSLTGSESISFVVDKCMSPFRRRSSNASSVESFNVEIETKKLFEIYQLALDELNYAEDSRGSLYYSGDRVAAKEAIEHCVEAYQLILEQSVTLEQQDKLKSTIGIKISQLVNKFDSLPLQQDDQLSL